MSSSEKLRLDETNDNVSINILNNKCLVKIFSFLTIEDMLQIKKVCKKWRDASQVLNISQENIKKDPSRSDDADKIHKHFEGFPEQSELNKVLCDCGDSLTSLTLSNYCYDSKIMFVISQHCHNLTKLELDLYKYNENDFHEAFTKLNKLKSITISYSNYVDHDDYGHDTLILQSLPQTIQEISLSSAAYDLDFLVPLSNNFTKTLDKFNALCTLELRYWSLETSVLNMILKKSTLTHLTLAESELIIDESLTSNLDNLEYLDLSYAKNIDKVLTSIVMSSMKLKHIDISQCTDVSKQALCHLGKLDNLKKIFINYIEQVDDSIISQFNNLNILECEGCTSVSDSSIIKILNNSDKLEFLNVQRTGVTHATLGCASQIVQSRNGDEKLHVLVSENIVDEFEAIDDIPLSLVINELL
ncbi:hypothetical protein HCN44_002266 [Aphidius gifuensis]|uniref:F-box domain-containing protein n=1 Tax=Aphidius gifuensis TaxID=684658 RepID=A0A835CXI6_APHGI|nr:uncharacterized protein LOC122860654 [Aphidius gifuensis]KAF7996620.1 hypothetical protein HCN44_002266 [Aphidius gifuensis]